MGTHEHGAEHLDNQGVLEEGSGGATENTWISQSRTRFLRAGHTPQAG